MTPAPAPARAACRRPLAPAPREGSHPGQGPGPRTRPATGARQPRRTLSVTAPLYFSTLGQHQPARRRRDRRRRRRLPLERHGAQPVHRHRRGAVRCRPRPTWTATAGSTPRTSTCPSPATRPCPGSATVADEDVVYYNAGTWTRCLRRQRPRARRQRGQTSTRSASPAATLYFSTIGNTVARRAPAATGDDTDIYRWNGSAPAAHTRVFDASAAGSACRPRRRRRAGPPRRHALLPLLQRRHHACQDWGRAGRGRGLPQRRAWSVYFDGTGNGLTSNNLDIDAFDLP